MSVHFRTGKCTTVQYPHTLQVDARVDLSSGFC